MIPGLARVPGIEKDTFPQLDKDYRRDNDPKFKKAPVSIIKATPLFIHNIEVVGNPKVEDEICLTLAKMYCDKNMSGEG